MTGSIARKVVQYFHAPPPPPREKTVPTLQAREQTGLTAREREVLDLLARGYLYKEISDTLHISVSTVNTHIRKIYDKFHVQSRGQAVARYAHLSADEG